MQAAAAQYPVREVRPIERSEEHQRILQPQLGDDVTADAFGRGGGKRVQRSRREIVAQAAEPPVLRPEIVAPLADAVRFIDRDEPEAHLLQRSAEVLAAVADQPLRRDVEEPTPIFANARQHRVPLVGQQRAVQIRRRDAVDAQAVDLIFHQRNQRRDNERQAATRRRVRKARGGRVNQRRRLEADRLAAARRQDDDAVARGEDRVHRFALQRTKAGKAPHAVEHVVQDAISVARIGFRRTHRPAFEMPPPALRRCRARWSHTGRR